MVCRTLRPRDELIRLTVHNQSGEVFLNCGEFISAKPVHGRSVYLCRNENCVAGSLKGNRLKGALEGGRGRKDRPRRTIQWPLEPSLIHTLTTTCTES
jgi:predicted RNA-binding protein YlxR (DUF448 family)